MKRILLLITLIATATCDAQTTEQVAKELQRQRVPHSKIVLAQARLETGNFTSRRCKQDHNLFGIKHDGRYATYSNWRESVKDYKRCISNRYSGGDYYAFLRRIKYASDEKYIDKIRNIIKTSR